MLFYFNVQKYLMHGNYGLMGKVKRSGRGGRYLLSKIYEACKERGWKWLANDVEDEVGSKRFREKR